MPREKINSLEGKESVKGRRKAFTLQIDYLDTNHFLSKNKNLIHKKNKNFKNDEQLI